MLLIQLRHFQGREKRICEKTSSKTPYCICGSSGEVKAHNERRNPVDSTNIRDIMDFLILRYESAFEMWKVIIPSAKAGSCRGSQP